MDKQSDNDSILQFTGYTVDRVEFTRNQNYTGDSVQLNFGISHAIDYQSPKASVVLSVSIFDKSEENNYPFAMNVAITGFFVFQSEEEDNTASNLLEINGVAILFPYIRAIISTLTANANVPPLILPTINVAQFISNSKQQSLPQLNSQLLDSQSQDD